MALPFEPNLVVIRRKNEYLARILPYLMVAMRSCCIADAFTSKA